MSNGLRIAALLGLAILIVVSMGVRLFLPVGDIELPPWAIAAIGVLGLIEKIAILAAVIYSIGVLVATLGPR